MSDSARPVTRYLRRILVVGAVLACLVFIVGAPIYLNRVEADLTDRVTEELSAAGYDTVEVSFSGQTGTFACTEPLDDPRGAVDLAYSVRGVRVIEDPPESCRVRVADAGESESADGSGSATNADATATTGGDAGVSADDDASTTSDAADLASVVEVLRTNPDYSLLSQLIEDAELGEWFDGTEDITVFAPTDAALNELPPDAVAQLRSQPELLARVLQHHVVNGQFRVGELEPGELDTFDGGTVTIATSGGTPTVDGAAVADADVLANNGVVHGIDAVLLPSDIDLGELAEPSTATVTFEEGAYRLSGGVGSDAVRQTVLAAAASAVGADQVSDDFDVDADAGLDAETADQMAAVVAVVPEFLVSGMIEARPEGLVISGVYSDEAGRVALELLAADIGADVDLSPQSDVDAESDDTATADSAESGDDAATGDTGADTAPEDAATDDTATDDAATNDTGADSETPEQAAAEQSAAELEAELNEYVEANPILFAPSSAILDDSAEPILDELVELIEALDGVSITVEGHTDSDGSLSDNTVLSQLRADAVRVALIERGLDADSITADGFGSTQPIEVNGVEDKNASRRVEFRVDI